MFTPGPWKIEGAAIVKGKEVIGLCSSTENNARLIAAAPEMYELLKESLGFFDAMRRSYPKMFTKTEKLILKIKGK